MEWTLVVGVANVALTAVILGFWKPWLGAYGGEKGKNLARKEDLNEILAEVRAVTITQKTIEAKLASDLWITQTLRAEKKDVYVQVFSTIHTAIRAYNDILFRTRAEQIAKLDPTGRATLIAMVQERLDEYHNCRTELIRLTFQLSLFGCLETASILSAFNTRGPQKSNPEDGFTNEPLDALCNLDGSLLRLARKDLGITIP